MIKKGDRVLYVLTTGDADKINRRRTTGESIAKRMAIISDVADQNPAVQGGQIHAWPAGAQAHIGTAVKEGQAFPGIVVQDHAGEGDWVNLQVFLDGSDNYWATSVREGNGQGTFSRLR